MGPVMVGPSSSHTGGRGVHRQYGKNAARAKEVARADIGLHGSFAETGFGHGTDRALLAGLLGMKPDDLRIPNAYEEANRAGMAYSFRTVELRDAHPNTALLRRARRVRRGRTDHHRPHHIENIDHGNLVLSDHHLGKAYHIRRQKASKIPLCALRLLNNILYLDSFSIFIETALTFIFLHSLMQKEPSTGGPFLSFDAEHQGQHQPDEKADLRKAVDGLLHPVHLRVARIHPERENEHQNHPKRARKEEKACRKTAQFCKHRFPVQPCAVYDQCREYRQKADRHQDAHLHKHRPDVPLGDGRDELPSHLHNTREQADYRTRYKQSAAEQVPRLHRGEAEKYDREQIDERHRGAEALGDGLSCHAVSRFSAHGVLRDAASLLLILPQRGKQARRMIRRACVF